MGKKKKRGPPTLHEKIVAALGYDREAPKSYDVVTSTFEAMKKRKDLPNYSPSAIYRYLRGESGGSTRLIGALMDLAGLSVVSK